MQAILWLQSRFAAIAFLRAGPQDLPASRTLIPFALSLYLLVDLLQVWPRLDPVHMLLVAGMDALLLAAFVQAVLRSMKLADRFRQTLGALYGAGAVVGVFGIPLAWQLERMDPASATLPVGLTVALLGYLAWNLMVMAHVLRHATGRGPGLALVLSLLYFFLAQLIMGLAAGGG